MTTVEGAAARRVTYQLDTLWDFDYEPTHHELESLYETAKKNQGNGSTAIDWSRPIGKEGPVLNIAMAFAGTDFFERMSEEEKKEAFTEVLIPRLDRLGLLSSRVAPRYQEIGLLD